MEYIIKKQKAKIHPNVSTETVGQRVAKSFGAEAKGMTSQEPQQIKVRDFLLDLSQDDFLQALTRKDTDDMRLYLSEHVEAVFKPIAWLPVKAKLNTICDRTLGVS